jgi:uncharacterized membrane protein
MIVGNIRQEARQNLQGYWTNLIPVWFIYFLITFGAAALFGKDGNFLGTIVTWVVSGPLLMWLTRMFLKIRQSEPIELGQLFDGFKEFGRTLSAYLLMLLFTILWMLLLIVPGIIAGLSYSMTFFIMAEDPNITASDAIKKSKEMMYGHKWDLFRMQLSFIGWFFLCMCSFGIGFLWLASYMMASWTVFYKTIKGGVEVNAGESVIFKSEEQV